MQQRSGSGSSSSSGDRQSVQEQNASTSSEGSIPGTVSAGLQQEELDPGINRVGRVIQLGMFAEERPQVEVPEGTTVELNFEQEDLRLVFEQLGDQLKINMVIDPTIDNKVSLRSSPDNPLQYEDLWPLMRMLARNAGVTIEQAGNIYRFMKNTSNIPVEIVMPSWLSDATSSEVLQVTPLTYISVETALALLNPLIQPDGTIIRLGQANLIGISGSPQQLQRVNALLDVIDDDPFQNQGIQLYELFNSQAAEVAQELTNILGLVDGEQSSYQVLGLERINAVLVLSPANRGFDEVTRWISILDAESQEQVEQLFFYKVKNLSATSLAQTLTSVFEQNEDNRPVASNETESAASNAEGEASTEVIVEESAPEGVVSANLSVTIVADEDTNSLLVRSTPRDYRQLLTTINNLDTVPPQVLINAVIGQVTLTDSNEFGVDWVSISNNVNTGVISSRVLPSGLLLTDGSGLGAQGSGLIMSRSFSDGSSIIDATLNAIAQDNEVRLLARPTILATNNQEGEIKVGQAVPIDQGTTVSGNGVTTSNIAYRDVGIVMTITPHINDDGYINLEIFQSLSSIEDGSGVAGNPVFSNQEITTTAVVSDQSTITLGGLIQEDDSDQNSGVPGLQKIPVLGALFSYQQLRSVRRELFVILRPQIINGDDRDAEVMQDLRDSFHNVAELFEEAGL
ncbi:MAG: type II secretion system secretin GspD [Gammaproteobacteria bacterium]|nr:type II secretion system secretin GspD [Gammaproteobacteria bacterium]MBT6043612.1 type II secretion system secretin GspD [Gammaproteobacteria bacterium]